MSKSVKSESSLLFFFIRIYIAKLAFIFQPIEVSILVFSIIAVDKFVFFAFFCLGKRSLFFFTNLTFKRYAN